jgi:MFS family permease
MWVCSVVLTAASQNYWMFLASRALTGLSEGAYLTVISPCVLEIAPGTSKTVWYSIFSCSIPVGVSIGYVFGSSGAADLGWQTVFIIEALVMVPLLLCFFKLYRDPRLKLARQVSLSPRSRSFCDEVKELGGNRVYVCMALGLSFMYFVSTGLGYWIPYIFKNQYGISPALTGVITGLIILVAGICGALTGSTYQDYKLRPFQRLAEANELTENEISDIRTILSLNLSRATSFTACVLLVVGALADSFPVFLICYGTGSFVNMMNLGSYGVALMSCVPKSLRNHSVAITLFVSQLLGGFPSTFIVGALIQYISIYWAVVILMMGLAPASMLWHLAYEAAKQNSTAYQRLLEDS